MLPGPLQRRFRFLRELGRGGFGVVYLVEEPAASGPARALKLVRRRRGSPAAALLAREFEILRQVRHPGLVEVYDFGRDEGSRLLWFTSEYVPGPDLFEASGAWGIAELEQALAALCDTLQFLHGRGILHNDLKPSNIRVPGGARSARLLDFGLASLGGGPLAGGTPPYMAPERLARPRGPGSVAADLYGLGALFYRCATRRPPFPGEDPRLLRAAAEGGPVPPRALRADLPHYLEAILLRLLAADPAARHGDAGELGRDLEEARLRLPPGHGPPRGPAGGYLLPSAPLLGRDDVLSALREGWARARAAGPVRIAVTGEAGFGKSRLLVELRQRLELDGAAVIAVSGRRGSSHAWALVGDIVRSMAALPAAPPPPLSLSPLVAGGPAETAGADAGDIRSGFAAYLRAASAVVPLAIIVDDIGWGDVESVAAVLDLGRGAGDPLRLLLAAAIRDEPEAAELFARLRADAWTIAPLGPLSDAALRALLFALFPGGLPNAVVADAVSLSGGNPLAMEQIARLWLESGAIRRAGGAFVADPHAPRGGAGRPLELIAARIKGLAEAEALALRLVALHAGPLPAGTLAEMVAGADAAVAALAARGLVSEGERGVDVRHPLVRDAATAALPEADLCDLHRRLGEALGAAGAPAEDRWRHALCGGEIRVGVELALEAGRRAEGLDDFHTGRVILEEAMRAAEPSRLDAATRVGLAESLAVCLDETGAAAEAAALLDRILSDLPAGHPEWRGRLSVKLGRALYRSGDFARAEQALGGVAASPADPQLRLEAATWRAWTAFFLAGAQAARQGCRAARPLARQLEGEPGTARLLVGYHLALGAMEMNASGAQAGVAELDEAQRVALQSGHGGLAARARSARALALTECGRLDESLAELAALDRILADGGSEVTWSQHGLTFARALHHRGETAAALARLEPLLERGSAAGRRSARCQIADVLADAGDPRALEHAIVLARDHLAGGQTGWLGTALGAGLRSALWLGLPPPELVARAVMALGPERVAAADRSEHEGALAMHDLSVGDPASAARRLAAAAESAARFDPLLLPRCLFHLAYAQALAGDRRGAARSAADAGAGYERHGNRIEQRRCSLLGRAISDGRVGREPARGEWLERLETAMRAVPAEGQAAEILAASVAGAAGATSVWLVSGPPDEERVVARAGPCGDADPAGWRLQIRAALASQEEAVRPGVGIVLPVTLADAGMALVVEDRTFPQALAAEAAAAGRLMARHALEVLARRQADADAAGARRALSQRPFGRSGAAVTSTRGAPAEGDADSRLVELTLGSVALVHDFPRIVARSRAMRKALETLDGIVEMDAAVLIVGETGTGKELCARALHDQGPRRAGPFVAVNCGAVPASLAESEFFGHAPGAFTGALPKRHAGHFEQAAGGTLFLDEVGELPPAVQAKLLRAVEGRAVRPVGGEADVRVDVRLVAATHRDLREESAAGRFRADLFYRLAVVEVKLPPLRERPEDIPPLVNGILARLRDPPPGIEPLAMDALCTHSWPGNVRELGNELERAVLLCGEGPVGLSHLSPSLRRTRLQASPGLRPLRAELRSLERRLIAEALHGCAGNKTAAARRLGLTREGLHLKMKRAGMIVREGRLRAGTRAEGDGAPGKATS